jgi:hypothetical protein
MPRSFVRSLLALAFLGALCGVYGCFNPFHPLLGSDTGVSDPPPVPNTPQNTLRLLEWAYNHKAIDEYRELFTADYRFVFSDLDSNGAAYRDVPWTRDDEIISTTKLFLGGDADQPAATDIRLTLDRNFQLSADGRPGKNAKWHKSINTQVILHILLSDGHVDDVTGTVKFFLVRGDSALIPDDLPLEADSLRWWIDRWEDQTAQGGGNVLWRRSTDATTSGAPLRTGTPAQAGSPAPVRTSAPRNTTPTSSSANPGEITTWGSLKHHYRL